MKEKPIEGYGVDQAGGLFREHANGVVSRPIVEIEGELVLATTSDQRGIADRRRENDRRNKVHKLSASGDSPIGAMRGFHLPEWLRGTDGRTRDAS